MIFPCRRYVEFDAELPKTLLDQRESGKKLALITNSDWEYTKVMMHHVSSEICDSCEILWTQLCIALHEIVRLTFAHADLQLRL